MAMVLEWGVRQAHLGVMVQCPPTFDHIVLYSLILCHVFESDAPVSVLLNLPFPNTIV